MLEPALSTAVETDWLSKSQENQLRTAIRAAASACRGPLQMRLNLQGEKSEGTAYRLRESVWRTRISQIRSSQRDLRVGAGASRADLDKV